MNTKKYNRDYYLRNRDKFKNKFRKWRVEHRKRYNFLLRKYYKEHWEELRIKRRLVAKALRLEIIKKLGSKCVRCGFDDWRALQVDHINGGGLKDVRDAGGPTNIKYLRMILTDKGIKYQLLCANCNWIKRYENNETTIKILDKTNL